MSFFSRLFQNFSGQPKQEQAVLVHLDGQNLPQEVYAECDLATLEDQIEEVLRARKLGLLDGNEIGEAEVVLFLYGTDAEALFRGIEPVLSAYPLCENARVVVRLGGPGAAQREVRIGRK